VTPAPVLDTHAWLWWLRRDERLGAASLEQLDAFELNNRPRISDISLWEVAMLVERRRLELSTPLRDWLDAASHPRTVRIVPISAAIAAETATLSQALRDPADRIIVATSRISGLPLLTHDRAILRSRLAARWSIV
jgi:PIN domain nuclease of toxin-antitoxin system